MTPGTASVPSAAIEVLDLVTELTAGFSAARDMAGVAREVERTVRRLVDVDHSGLYLWDPATESLRLSWAAGFTDAEVREAERTAWDRHPGAVFRTGQMLHVTDTAVDHRSQSSSRSFEIRSRLYMPIRQGDQVIAVLGLASRRPDAFGPLHIHALRFVCRLTGVVYGQIHDRNARLKAQADSANVERRLQLVLGSLPIALLAVEESGRIALAQGRRSGTSPTPGPAPRSRTSSPVNPRSWTWSPGLDGPG